MSVEQTKQVLEAYWREHDPRHVAEDAVFVMLPTGEEIRGRESIAQHLNTFYHVTLDAHAEIVSSVFADGQGVLEAVVVGKHTGEFAGIPATGRDVRVPLCVCYELQGDQIQRARIYLMASVLLQQIGSAQG
jgi:steroid delta-isomerase-like uncharacterized protein